MQEGKKNKVVIVAAIGLMICFLIFNQVSKSINKFSSEKWKENTEYRKDMVDDIVRSDVLIGKERDEVIVLLGQPSEYEDKGKLKQLNAKTMKYELEHNRIGSFKTYLCVDLENNTVVLAYKYHHKK